MRHSWWISLLVTVATACASKAPEPFGVRVEHWNGDAVDTFAGTVTRDQIPDADTTIALTLSPEELNRIRQNVVDSRFFELPDTILGSSHNGDGILTRIEVRMGRRSKTVVVRESTGWDRIREQWKVRGRIRLDERNNERQRRVEKLSRHIFELVKARPEWQALPRARGGYL